MVIDLRSITEDRREFDFTLDPEWWQNESADDRLLGLDGSLKVHVSISKARKQYILKASLFGCLRLGCDRCLEPYSREINSDVDLFLALPSDDATEGEVELLEEDMAVDFITGTEIDLREVVRGQIYLSLPMQSFCREDCAGLCVSCGADLNIKKCDCEQTQGHPAFSKLQNPALKKT